MIPYKSKFTESEEPLRLSGKMKRKTTLHNVALDLIDYCGGDTSSFDLAIDDIDFIKSYSENEKQFIKDNEPTIIQTALEYSEEGNVE